MPWEYIGSQIGYKIPLSLIKASNLRQTIFRLIDLLSDSANPLIWNYEKKKGK